MVSKTQRTKRNLATILAFVLVLSQMFFLPIKAHGLESNQKPQKLQNVVLNNYDPDKVELKSLNSNRFPTLTGTKFGIYNTEAGAKAEEKADLIDTVTIGDDNSGLNSLGPKLTEGDYYVKELAATKGFLKNNKVYPVKVTAGEISELNIENELDKATPVTKKVADKKRVAVGDTIKYTITAENNSKTGTAYDFVINDDLQTGDSAKIDVDSIKADINGKSFTDFATKDIHSIVTKGMDLHPGETFTLTYSVDILAKSPTGVYKNVCNNTTDAKVPGISKITTEVVNGTITPSKEVTKDDTTEITYSPNEGHEIDKIEINGKNIPITDENKGSYTFTNVIDDTSIKVVYKGTNITEFEKSFDKTEYKLGDIVKNTITLKNTGVKDAIMKDIVIRDKNQSGFTIDTKSIKVDYTKIDGKKTSPAIKVIDEKTGEFTVTIPEFNGTEKIVVTFDSTFNKNVEKISNQATLENSKGDTIGTTETSSTPKYTITTEVVNGKISDPTEVKRGGETTVTYTPNKGYEIDKIEVNGKDVPVTDTNKGSFTFTDVKDNSTIKVTYKGTSVPELEKSFDKKEYKLGDTVKNTIVVKNDGVKDSVMKNVVVKDNNQSGLTIDTNTIKVAYNKIAGKESEPIVKVVNAETGEFTVTIPEFNGTENAVITFDAKFTKNVEKINNKAELINEDGTTIKTTETSSVPKYTVTTEVVNGKISTPTEVTRGGETTVTYTPNDGYEIDKIEVNGNEVPVTNENKDKTVITNITDNTTIKVTYKGTPMPKITKSFDKSEYHTGDVVKATIKVIDEGKATAVSKNLKVTDLNAKGFKIKTDTIKAVVTDSTERETSDKPVVNVINPETGEFNVTLASLDTTQEFTITFDMEITGEVGDIANTAKLTTEEYPDGKETTTNSKLLFNVITKIIGGTITPSASNVPFGGDFNVEYTPEKGYYLNNIVIDGVNTALKGIEKNFTFKGVQKDHNISVEFRKIPTPEIAKTTDKADYIKDEVVKYKVEITNKTDAIAEDVIVNDVIDENAVKDGIISLNKDSFMVDGKKVSSLQGLELGTLEPGQKVVITYEATILSDITAPVKNTVSVIAKGMEKEVVTENEIKTHEVPKLIVNKKADKASYKKDEVIKYTITVKNDGKFDVTNINLKDELKGDNAKNIQIMKKTAKLNGAAIDFDKMNITKLAPGEIATITYEAKVLENVDSVVNNEVTATADWLKDKDGNSTPITVTNEVKTEFVKGTVNSPKTNAESDNTLPYFLISLSILGAAIAIRKYADQKH